MFFGDLQMMMALITRDGHYDEHVQTIPLVKFVTPLVKSVDG